MNSGESCVQHTVLLETGEIIEVPKHDSEGSLNVDLESESDQCPDCGVARGGTHHPHCDWARIPSSQKQILIQAVEWPYQEPTRTI